MTTNAENVGNVNYNFTPTDERPIFLTELAIGAIKDAIASDGNTGDGIRISVVGGGCAGYQYNLDFEQEERIGDIVLDFGGLKIYLDSISSEYLKGTVIDYVKGLQGAGFKFINPNARRTCGCGSSFA